MPALLTPRLLLLPLSRAVMEARLRESDFTLTCQGPQGPLKVHFSPEWPGDPLAFFPAMLAGLAPEQEEVDPDGSFKVVTRDVLGPHGAHEAVGQLGTIGPPDAQGAVEIGYGLNPAAWGRGYATEAVAALTAHLLQREGVQAVTAQTALSNRASERVLEKVGFLRTGRGWTEEDGELTTWALSRR